MKRGNIAWFILVIILIGIIAWSYHDTREIDDLAGWTPAEKTRLGQAIATDNALWVTPTPTRSYWDWQSQRDRQIDELLREHEAEKYKNLWGK